MKCSRVRMPGRGVAIVCGGPFKRARRCRHCACEAPFLCDWKIEALGTLNTCNAPICSAHALQAGPDRHLCPAHQVAYQLWLRDLGIAY